MVQRRRSFFDFLPLNLVKASCERMEHVPAAESRHPPPERFRNEARTSEGGGCRLSAAGTLKPP